MFEITIKGDTLSELATNMLSMAKQFQTTVPEEPTATPKSRRKGREIAEEIRPEIADDDDTGLTGEDALDAPVKPMPDTAKQVVDAGTGKPAGKGAADDAPITMTFDDVKVAAAKLAAKDTPALAKILKKYGAANLSGVDKAKLGDFAADVMEALG